MRLATERAAKRRGCGVARLSPPPAPQFEADFRQLRGFARASFAANQHHHLIFRNRPLDVFTPLVHRQSVVVVRAAADSGQPLQK